MTNPLSKRLLAAAACAALALPVLSVTATASAAITRPAATAEAPRGAIVSATRLDRLSPAQVSATLRAAGFPAPEHPLGVDVYRVVYRTTGADGEPTTAGGVVTLPRSRDGRLSFAVYEHGTLPTKRYAPSVAADSDGRLAPVMFAAAGFAGLAPDYLGLGLGPGRHPYMDAASEVTASADLLHAARDLAARHGRTLDGRVMVTGFSQGGQAAMALGRALQQGAVPGLRLAALAPISGPYAVERAELPATLSGDVEPHTATFYLAYWITSMNRLHHLYDTPGQAFRAPYDTKVEGLFDGRHTEEQIAAALPASPAELLTDEFLAQVRQPTGAFLEALRANDTTCTGWRPRVPVTLYASRGDRDVAIANSRLCRDDLVAGGADVRLVDVGDVDHVHGALRSLPRVLRAFQDLLS
ncbi:hypothetical protein IL992_12200 [Microbispora sp. NEAU-D428]|uniref:hypothetical protein n=1 Tax=Microbispora sitophila TaxID=2771537 RepID=UPI001867A3A1|nr:hypothetical protein [Microbispora sitophila]MBE3009947.1 hypothetical protein [Microbispora sitophila]